jgi:uncharacterized protein HemX
MNKIITIILAIVLASSLAANGLLGFQISKKNKTITEYSVKLSTTITELEMTKIFLSQTQDQLSQTQGKLTQTEADLTMQKTQNGSLNEQVTALTNDNNTLFQKLDSFMCSSRLDPEQVMSAGTNESLIDPINKVLEQQNSGSMVYQGYTFFWNNSKDALFTYLDKEQKGKLAAVIWNFEGGNLAAIYNLNGNCFLYSVHQ